jgi:hypothetical protein
MIYFAMVWLILMTGLITNNAGFFIVGGVLSLLKLLHVINSAALAPSQTDAPCTQHKWTKHISGGNYCTKCKKRPDD